MSYSSTLCEVIFKFYQEGNTNGSTDDTEELEVIVETVCGDAREEGYFYTIKTSTGWSFENREEINKMFEDIDNAINAMK